MLFSCSGEEEDQPAIDQPNKTVLITTKTAVKTYETVQVKTDHLNLKESYQGNWEGQEVVLYKTNETGLVFVVPNVESGDYTLDFELGQLKFKVSELSLDKTADAVISDLQQTITTTIPEHIATQMNTQISTIWDAATEAEKKKAALFFEANKQVYLDMITLISTNSGKTANPYQTNKTSVISDNVDFGIAVLVMGAGVWSTYAGIKSASAPGYVIAGVGVVLVKTAWKEAKLRLSNVTNFTLRVIGYSIEVILEEISDKTKHSAKDGGVLNFTNQRPLQFVFTQKGRTLDLTDRTENSDFFISFFDAFDNMNGLIETINYMIDLANKVPLVNIDLVSPETIVDKASTKTEIVNYDNFSGYNFAVANDQVNLNATLNTNENLEITLTAADGVDLSSPLSTQLIINYDDAFNTVSESFDVRLEDSISVVGKTLTLKVNSYCINGTPDDDFPNFDENYNATLTFNEDGTISQTLENPNSVETNSYQQNGENLSITFSYRNYFSEFPDFGSDSCDGKTSFVTTFIANLSYDVDKNAFVGSVTETRPETAGQNPDGTSCYFSGLNCSGTGEVLLD